MIKINCLILITGLSLLLSGCNKDVEINYSKETIIEENRLTFTSIEKERNIGMYYQEQGTLYCGNELPIINI